MANRIFLRLGTWYRAAERYLSSDLEITDVVDNPDAEFPEVVGGGGGGGSQTLQEVLTTGSVLTADADIDADNNTFQINKAQLFTANALIDDESEGGYISASASLKRVVIGAFDDTDSAEIKVTTTNATLLKGGVTKDIATVKYLVYTALLSQTGTDAPVATVLENTLGGTVIWTYSSVGNYNGTLNGAFTANKTVCLITPSNASKSYAMADDESGDKVYVATYSIQGTSYEDEALYLTTVEIRVYP